jgi:hypothetical protein
MQHTTETTETTTTTAPTVTIIAPTETLYARQRGQHRPQPAEIRLDCQAATLTAGIDWASPATPFDQWHHLTLAWEIPALTQSAVERLLAECLADAEQVIEGFSRRWDGSNHKGRYDDDAYRAIQRIADRCEAAQWDDSETLEVWDGWDYVCAGNREEVACREHNITAETTDDELSELETRLLEEAGSAVVEDLERALFRLRDGARIRAEEAAEEDEDEDEDEDEELNARADADAAEAAEES